MDYKVAYLMELEYLEDMDKVFEMELPEMFGEEATDEEFEALMNRNYTGDEPLPFIF